MTRVNINMVNIRTGEETSKQVIAFLPGEIITSVPAGTRVVSYAVITDMGVLSTHPFRSIFSNPGPSRVDARLSLS